jgi:hypothetical protein
MSIPTNGRIFAAFQSSYVGDHEDESPKGERVVQPATSMGHGVEKKVLVSARTFGTHQHKYSKPGTAQVA